MIVDVDVGYADNRAVAAAVTFGDFPDARIINEYSAVFVHDQFFSKI